MFDIPANDQNAAATVRETIRMHGVGLHSGAVVEMVIDPALPGEGIRFVRADLEGRMATRTIAADPMLVTKTQLGTVLTNEHGAAISTVEHLMAAFAMRGITEATVFISGPEVPIMDGSSKDFIAAIDAAGIRVFARTIEKIEPAQPVTVTHGDSWITAEPIPEGSGSEIILDVTIAFDHEAIGEQRIIIEGDRDTILGEVAEARTFTELRHVEALREMGLARGGSLDNAIVLGAEGVMNPQGLRMEREFVRHKALDLVGDLYLLGLPLGCKITAYKPGHTINTMMALALADAAHAETELSAVPA